MGTTVSSNAAALDPSSPRSSIYWKGETQKLRTQVGTADYQKVDAHLEGPLARRADLDRPAIQLDPPGRMHRRDLGDATRIWIDDVAIGTQGRFGSPPPP